jgi:hypothetical protein
MIKRSPSECHAPNNDTTYRVRVARILIQEQAGGLPKAAHKFKLFIW